MKLTYGREVETDIIGYSDADWAGDMDKRGSTSGYIFLMHGGAISWRSKRHQTVALSSTEAEYMATVERIQEAMWLKSLYDEFYGETKPIKIWADNKSAISVLKNNNVSSRTKHIEAQIHKRKGRDEIC